MTRSQRQAVTEAKFAGLWLGSCFLLGFVVTFPFALRTALRLSKETP